ncbi:hypothetical protein ScPMuIL_009015 [Solemya velum]
MQNDIDEVNSPAVDKFQNAKLSMAEQKEKKQNSQSRWSHDSGVEVETSIRKEKELGEVETEMHIARGKVFQGKESTPYRATVENRVKHNDSETDPGSNRTFLMSSLSANLAILRTRPGMVPMPELDTQIKLDQKNTTSATKLKSSEQTTVVSDNGDTLPVLLKINENISLDKSVTDKFLSLGFKHPKQVNHSSDSDDSSELTRKRAMLKNRPLISKSSSGSSDSLSSPRNSLTTGTSLNFRENKGKFESLSSQSSSKREVGLSFSPKKGIASHTTCTRRTSLPETAQIQRTTCINSKTSPLGIRSGDGKSAPEHQRTVHRKHKSEVSSSSALLIRQLTKEPRSGRDFVKTEDSKINQDTNSNKDSKTNLVSNRNKEFKTRHELEASKDLKSKDFGVSKDVKSSRDLGFTKDSKTGQKFGKSRDLKSGMDFSVTEDSENSRGLSSVKNVRNQPELATLRGLENGRENGVKQPLSRSKHSLGNGSKYSLETNTVQNVKDVQNIDSSVRRDRFSSRSTSFNAEVFGKLKSSFEQPGARPTSPRSNVAIPITSHIHDRKELLKKTSSWESKKTTSIPASRPSAKPMSIGKVSDFVKTLHEKYPDKQSGTPKINIKHPKKTEVGISNVQSSKPDIQSSDVESDLYEELSSVTELETGNEADEESGTDEDIYQCIDHRFVADRDDNLDQKRNENRPSLPFRQIPSKEDSKPVGSDGGCDSDSSNSDLYQPIDDYGETDIHPPKEEAPSPPPLPAKRQSKDGDRSIGAKLKNLKSQLSGPAKAMRKKLKGNSRSSEMIAEKSRDSDSEGSGMRSEDNDSGTANSDSRDASQNSSEPPMLPPKTHPAPPPLPPRHSGTVQQSSPEETKSPPLPPRQNLSNTLGLDTVVPIAFISSDNSRSTGDLRQKDQMKNQHSKSSSVGNLLIEDDLLSVPPLPCRQRSSSTSIYSFFSSSSSPSSTSKRSTASSSPQNSLPQPFDDLMKYKGSFDEEDMLYIDMEDDQLYGTLDKRYNTHFDSEPLYQVYSQRKITRASFHGYLQSFDSDTEDDEYGKDEDRLYEDLNDLMGDTSEETVEEGNKGRLSTLEMFGKSGAVLRALWSEMPETSSCRKKPEFVEALRNLEHSAECQGLPMISFLLLPMQRITRLPLLVDAICHRLEPKTEQHKSATMALGAVHRGKVVQKCNDAAKKMQQTEDMCLLAQKLDFKIKEFPIISSTRYLVKQGELTRVVNDTSSRLPFGKARPGKQIIYLFLFCDMLLYCKKKGANQYTVLDYAHRNSLHVQVVDTVDKSRYLPLGIPSGCKNLFLLVLLENFENKQVEMVLSCDSTSDRMRWMDALVPAAKSSDNEKIYEDWAQSHHVHVKLAPQ